MANNQHRVTKAQYEALAEFRYGLRQFLHFSENAAQAAGLTPQQHQAMLAIKGFPGRNRITIGELAERLQIMHHSAVGLADRLVAEGYVQRVQSQKDRRRVFLALTSPGELLLGKLSADHREQLRSVGPQIRRLLKVLQGNVSVGKTGRVMDVENIQHPTSNIHRSSKLQPSNTKREEPL